MQALLEREFVPFGEWLALNAQQRPDDVVFVDGEETLTAVQLDRLADRTAAALLRDGIGVNDAVAICAGTSIAYLVAFMGAVRAGVAVAPLPPSATPDALAGMILDSGAKLLFTDAASRALIEHPSLKGLPAVFLDGSPAPAFADWLAPPDTVFTPPALTGSEVFNIIYSSGTTGAPKGIVHSHKMRWVHVKRGANQAYGPGAVKLVSTTLYSNATLVGLIAAIALGAQVVLMRRFDPKGFLALVEEHRATHAMLVPVQYQRLMDCPEFDAFDLSSLTRKFCTSAPFAPALKLEVVRRWPGALTESFGMTEGGATSFLPVHEAPHKAHTVGKPSPGHEMRLIDEQGHELPPGSTGEIVGWSPAIMTGYHNQPELTAQTFWTAPDGRRFIRTGDIGRFDEDGYLVLLDRKKDVIISGGFNIYPSDIEAALRAHEAVTEAAVTGVPSKRWGETPAAFVVLKDGADIAAEPLREWLNARLGATQRIAALEVVDALPRSAIGKVLKRELRDGWVKRNAEAA